MDLILSRSLIRLLLMILGLKITDTLKKKQAEGK